MPKRYLRGNIENEFESSDFKFYMDYYGQELECNESSDEGSSEEAEESDTSGRFVIRTKKKKKSSKTFAHHKKRRRRRRNSRCNRRQLWSMSEYFKVE